MVFNFLELLWGRDWLQLDEKKLMESMETPTTKVDLEGEGHMCLEVISP